MAEEWQHAGRPVEGTTVWCAGTDTRGSALPGASHQRETTLSDARWQEHRPSDVRRTRAQQAGPVEAGIVFRRGGTRVPAPQGRMCGVQCHAVGAAGGVVRRYATTVETAANRPEKRAAQTSSWAAQRLKVFAFLLDHGLLCFSIDPVAVHGVHPRKRRLIPRHEHIPRKHCCPSCRPCLIDSSG